MTEEEMLNAVRNNDKNYDGMFFYAVKTTGIFCRPSCKSKIPKKEIYVFLKQQMMPKRPDFVHVKDAGAICLAMSQ